MEVTKQQYEQAVRMTRKVAVEMVKVSAEVAPLAGQKSDFGMTLRNAVAYMVALAFFRNIGEEKISKDIGKATMSVAKDVLKQRLSEANKVRRLHPEWQQVATHWALQEFGGKDEETELVLPGVSVAEALKHPTVARPKDIFRAVEKGTKQAALYGASLEDILEAVSRAYSETEGSDEDAVPEEDEAEVA